MSIVRIDQYTSDGRLREGYDAWAIYAAFTDPASGGLVKIGRSTAPIRRLYEVHSGSPHGVVTALWAWVGSKSKAVSVEKRIHNRLAEKRTRGEWFEFDYADPDDKALFHGVTKAVYLGVVGKPLQWSRVGIREIVECRGIVWKDGAP